jgi:hypothetical protein
VSAGTVAPAGQALLGDVLAVVALVDQAATPEDCLVLRAQVVALAEAEKARTKSRSRVVALLEAAGIHLGRAGVRVPLPTGCRLASLALVDAAALLGVAP